MSNTKIFKGNIHEISADLAIFLHSIGYLDCCAVTVTGDQTSDPESYRVTHDSNLTLEENKHRGKPIQKIHKLYGGLPITFLIIGETNGLKFSVEVESFNINLFVDIEPNPLEDNRT